MLEAVQELCRSSYGVPTLDDESHGCAWHFQHAYAGDDELERPLEWMSGTIVNDYDLTSKIRARWSMRNRELYTGQWANTRGSRVRERQVCGQKVGRVTRPPHRTRVADPTTVRGDGVR